MLLLTDEKISDSYVANFPSAIATVNGTNTLRIGVFS
jgi:hypothetical protein